MLIRLYVMDELTVRTLVSMEIGGVKEIFVHRTDKVVNVIRTHVIYKDTPSESDAGSSGWSFFDKVNVFTIRERRRGSEKIRKITYLLRHGHQFLVINIGIKVTTRQFEIELDADFFDLLMARISSETHFRIEIPTAQRQRVNDLIKSATWISLWPGQGAKEMFEEGNGVLKEIWKLQNKEAFPFSGSYYTACEKALRKLFYETNLGRFLSHWAKDGGPLRPREP